MSNLGQDSRPSIDFRANFASGEYILVFGKQIEVVLVCANLQSERCFEFYDLEYLDRSGQPSQDFTLAFNIAAILICQSQIFYSIVPFFAVSFFCVCREVRALRNSIFIDKVFCAK